MEKNTYFEILSYISHIIHSKPERYTNKDEENCSLQLLINDLFQPVRVICGSIDTENNRCGCIRRNGEMIITAFHGKPPMILINPTYVDGRKMKVAVCEKHLLINGHE